MTDNIAKPTKDIDRTAPPKDPSTNDPNIAEDKELKEDSPEDVAPDDMKTPTKEAKDLPSTTVSDSKAYSATLLFCLVASKTSIFIHLKHGLLTGTVLLPWLQEMWANCHYLLLLSLVHRHPVE